MHKLFGRPIHVTVDSVGRMGKDGLILEQTIREAEKPPSMRRWTIRRVAQNRYTGTLTDAVGPVTAQIAVLNRLVVRKFGARVAMLSETIKRVTP